MNSKFLLALLFFTSIFVSPFAQRVTIAEAHIVSQRNDVIRWAQTTAATKFYQVFLPNFNLQNYEMPISEAGPRNDNQVWTSNGAAKNQIINTHEMPISKADPKE